MMAGREVADENNKIMIYLENNERKGGSANAMNAITLTFRAQTQIIYFGQLLFVPPSLLIGSDLCQLRTKALEYSKYSTVYSIKFIIYSI